VKRIEVRTLIMSAAAFVLLAAAAPKSPKPVKLPKGPGSELVRAKCGMCHVLPVVIAKRKTEDAWAQTVDQMISRGAKVSDEDYDIIVDYLAKNFGVTK
jgi:cytochrome c5